MRKFQFSFEIQKALSRAWFKVPEIDPLGGQGTSASGDKPATDSSGHQTYDTKGEAESALGDTPGVVKQNSDGQWVVSTSNSAAAQDANSENLALNYEYLGISQDLAAMQIEIAAKQTEIMDEQWNRYLEVYAPVEDEWVASAQAGLPSDYYVSRAAADVDQSFSMADAAGDRQAASYGIDPSSDRYMAIEESEDIQKAAAKAGAMTNARMGVNDVNYQRQSDVVKTGKGIPTEAASIGASASSTLSGASNTYASGYGGVSQAYNELGNYYSTAANQDSANKAATQAATIGAIGTGVGTLAGVGLGVASL